MHTVQYYNAKIAKFSQITKLCHIKVQNKKKKTCQKFRFIIKT